MTRVGGRVLGWLVPFVTLLAVTRPAAAWEPFRSANRHVTAGNEQMAAHEATAALEAYDRAVRELPNEPRVHLNRGLALLESGELERAQEALTRATEPPADRAIRADAHYDLGLSYYRQGQAAAEAEDHREAQRLFRTAADSFRQSLRMRPGNADAGWNLELALRRLHEEEEAQEQQDQQEQDQQNQDQQNQDQQNQDQQNQDQQNQDQQNQDQQSQDQQNQDQQGQDQQGQDQQGQDQQGQDQQGQDQQGQDQQGQDQQEQEDQPAQDNRDGRSPGEGEQPDERPAPPTGTQEGSLPPQHRRVLDALSDREDNLERHRARARAARERRRVEQDW